MTAIREQHDRKSILLLHICHTFLFLNILQIFIQDCHNCKLYLKTANCILLSNFTDVHVVVTMYSCTYGSYLLLCRK